MKKVPPLKKFSFRDFFPRKRVVDDEIALLCNTDYDCWFYSTLCIPFLFEKMYTVCIVYYSVKNNTLMYSCWLTTTLSLLSPMIFKQHTGAWNTHNNKKATKNIYFKNRKKRCFVLIRIRILFSIVSILDVFRDDIELDKWHSKYLHTPIWQLHNYLVPIYVL